MFASITIYIRRILLACQIQTSPILVIDLAQNDYLYLEVVVFELSAGKI
jgi:hypothetical protein